MSARAALPLRCRQHGIAPGFWVLAGSAAAAALVAVLVSVVHHGPDPSPPRGDDDAERASPAVAFGSSTASENFVHAFQQRVTEELHVALDSARRDEDRRLQEFEQRSRAQAAEQFDAMRRAVAEARGPEAANVDRLGSSGAATDETAPRVHTRTGPADTATAEAATDRFALTPDDIRRLEEGSSGAPTRLTVGLSPRGAPRAGDADIAPHGFVDGRLLNGVVAVVGGPERESIVALTGSYEAANGYRSALDGCFVLVQGRPEAASGRIDFKASRLTCNFPDGASKTWDVSGWLVDGDGIRGIRATIVQNLDKKAAVAGLGGAVGGIGHRLSQQQYDNGVTPLGGASAIFRGSSAVDALGGAGEGAANAIQQSIGEYFQLFAPTLQVGGGTAVTVVLANELALPDSGRGLTTTHAAGP